MDLSASTGQFADELSKVLISQAHTGNALVSPLSLVTALSMLLVGTRGPTRSSLELTLNLPSNVSQAAVDSFYHQLISAHKSRSNDDNKLLINNNLLLAKSAVESMPIVPSYEETVVTKYGAQINSVDFADGQSVLDKVNSWISESTEGLIPTLLSEPPGSETLLLILNSIYFRSDWKRKLSFRGERNFLVNGKENKIAEYAVTKDVLKYLSSPVGDSNDAVQVVALPYKSQASMVFILPPESMSVNELFAQKNVFSLAKKVIAHGEDKPVELLMPKFKFESKIAMVDHLKSLGAENLFSPGADFSGINGASNIKLSNVQHATAIDVDETGTRAAAASGVKISLHSGVQFTLEPILVDLNRPFAFVIYDTLHNIPVFVGKLADP